VPAIGEMSEAERIAGTERRGRVPLPKVSECIEDGCWRPPYVEERCKAHRDLHHYKLMRILERECRPGIRIVCRTRNSAVETGVACSSVRLDRRRVVDSTRIWPSVVVQLDGHGKTYTWPAVDVEVA
jgi:hypothetical protein